MGRPLVWFRADLRVRDHRALAAACAGADEPPVGVFLIAHDQWKRHDWGANRIWFMLSCAIELAEALAAHGVELVVAPAPRFEEAPRAILQVAKDHDCDRLFYNIEYEVNETARDQATRALLESEGIEVSSFHDQMMGAGQDLRTGAGDFYRVFTPFSKAWHANAEGDDQHEVVSVRFPDGPRVDPKRVIEALRSALPKPTADLSGWKPGEQAALERLDEFIEARVSRYSEDRDFPAVRGTSGISAYLATGAISARTCLAAARDANKGNLHGGDKGIDTWIKELIWRDFYKHVLIGFPHVCMRRPMKQDAASVPWRDDDEGFEAWCEGRTGYPIVDAAMRQLTSTGWMHNRLRMIVAMFLSKHLLIDWRRGEAFFMRHLVDGDFASNNGGWQWSSSTGADAAPYFRIFNPTTQSERFDKKGEFIRRLVSELADVDAPAIHNPPDLMRSATDYPMPMVDHAAARKRALDAFSAS